PPRSAGVEQLLAGRNRQRGGALDPARQHLGGDPVPRNNVRCSTSEKSSIACGISCPVLSHHAPHGELLAVFSESGAPSPHRETLMGGGIRRRVLVLMSEAGR